MRALTVLLCGVTCVPAFYQSAHLSDSTSSATQNDSGGGALFFFLAFFPLTITGLVMVRTSIRRWLAARHRWQVWKIETHRPEIQEWVHLIDDQGSITATFVLRKWTSRTFNRDDQFAWFAGHPNKAGLIAKPGGARTRLAYRSIFYSPPPFGRAVAPRVPTLTKSPSPGSTTPSGFTLERNGNQTVMRPPRGHPQGPLFGGLDDDRFPSPRKLRRTLAYLLDIVIHVAIGFGIYFVSSPATQFSVMHQEWNALQVNWAAVIGYSLLASFIDRVVLQAMTHTTIGKAVFGLAIIDRDTGHYPRLRWLLASWLVSGLMAIQLPFALLELGGGIGPERPERYMLPAVRRRDAKAGPSKDASTATGTTEADSAPDSDRSQAVRSVRDAVGDGIIGPSNR
ncbi:RDD family protein [Nocardia sp. IBHARD005]|uniref:RDD family protein n=1 Tax=Nocardia sp. IBHARD005 TaxID=3457765 RepID=UPI00405A2054